MKPMIIEAIYNAISIIVFVSVLTVAFYLCGTFFIKILRLPNLRSNSFIIATGMSCITFLSYYADKLSIPLINFIVIMLLIITVFLLGYSIKNNFQNKYNIRQIAISIYTLPAFALLFTLQAMIAFKTVLMPVGTIMNFDIFYWSLLAEHVFGGHNFKNIIPGGENLLNFLYIDGWGTYFLLGLMSKLLKISPIETAPYYTIYFLTLIGLAIFEIIKKIFYFRNGIAFILSFLTAGSTFLFFIAYNQFDAELAATFYYLVGIFIVIYLAKQRWRLNFKNSVLLTLLPLLGIFLVYQSGFLVFFIFLTGFCVLSIGIKSFKTQSMLSAICHSLLVFTTAIIIIMLLLPEFTLHLFNRIFFVLTIHLDGWQMPLLSPFILFSIPDLGVLPDELGLQLIKYIEVVLLLVLLLILAFSITKRLTKHLYKNFIGTILLFCSSLIVYFLLYYINGNSYQVWKFAGFTILPVSFIFLSVLISPIYYSKYNRKYSRYFLFCLLFLICIFVVKYPFKNKQLFLYTEQIAQLQIIKKELIKNKAIKNIVIATKNDAQMMVIDLFAGQFRLFPLIKVHRFTETPNYLAIRQLDQNKTVALVLSQCYPGYSEYPTINQFKIISLNKFISTTPLQSECLTLDRLNLLTGISTEWL